MGGGSSSGSKTYNNTTVAPVTNVDFDVESIADAMREATASTLSIEEAKLSLAKAGLQIEDTKNKLEEAKLKSNALNSEKLQSKLSLVAVAVGGYFIYKQLKKGGKK